MGVMRRGCRRGRGCDHMLAKKQNATCRTGRHQGLKGPAFRDWALTLLGGSTPTHAQGDGFPASCLSGTGVSYRICYQRHVNPLYTPSLPPVFSSFALSRAFLFSRFLLSTAFLQPSPHTVVAQMATAVTAIKPQLIVLNQPTPIV